jgi:hypothetical protein
MSEIKFVFQGESFSVGNLLARQACDVVALPYDLLFSGYLFRRSKRDII